MGTRVYGASDDLIEFEGEIRDEIGGSEDPKRLLFSDGTILSIKYGKPGDGGAIWAIDLVEQGPMFERIDVCHDEHADPYSDVAVFKKGLTGFVSYDDVEAAISCMKVPVRECAVMAIKIAGEIAESDDVIDVADKVVVFLEPIFSELSRLRAAEVLVLENRLHASEDEREAVPGALDLIRRFGGIEGDHHKAWVIDQVTRALTGDGYERFVADCCAGEDGPETYDWDEGIAP